jgi:hypothetical protein
MLPPGRLRLSTSPYLIGSLPLAKTIGMVFAASAETTLPVQKITATWRLIRSAGSAGSRS